MLVTIHSNEQAEQLDLIRCHFLCRWEVFTSSGLFIFACLVLLTPACCCWREMERQQSHTPGFLYTRHLWSSADCHGCFLCTHFGKTGTRLLVDVPFPPVSIPLFKYMPLFKNYSCLERVKCKNFHLKQLEKLDRLLWNHIHRQWKATKAVRTWQGC